MRSLSGLMLLVLMLAPGCGEGDAKPGEDTPSEADADTDADTDTDTDADADTDTGTDTGSATIDADHDGVEAGEDCDDADPTLGARTLDTDCDRLTNADEAAWGSDPEHPDTDGDWVADGDDIDDGRTPTLAEALKFTLGEGETKRYNLIGVPEFDGVDVALLLDTTPDPTHILALQAKFAEIEDLLAGLLPDISLHYGLATFDDYALLPFGGGTDRPFVLHQPMTSDTDAVQSALGELTTGHGADAADSAMEALYQSLTGAGYDQNCDGDYEPSTDILPFIASPSDPFSGTAGGASGSSGGLIGGLGFREHAQPIIIYITDNPLRDPDEGDDTPGGCPIDAGRSDVVTAADGIGAILVGIKFGFAASSITAQMELLASETGSGIDTDGDGTAEELLVFGEHGMSSSDFQDTIVEATLSAVSIRIHEPGPLGFVEVEPTIVDDARGFVAGITPSSFTGFDPEDSTAPMLRFALDFEGTTPATEDSADHAFSLVLVGDGETPLGSLPIQVVVPGLEDE